MKIIYFCLLFFFCNVIHGQINRDSLNFHLNHENYTKAISFGELLKADLQISLNPDQIELAAISHNLGLSYFNTGSYAKAESNFIQALDILRDQSGEDNPQYAIVLKFLAKNYKEKGNYSEAEKLIKEVITTIKTQYGVDHPDYADVLNILGTIYSAQENYELAIPLYLDSAKIFRSIFGENNVYAHILINLGNAYKQIGDFSEAEILFENALLIIKKNGLEKNSEYALALIYLQDIFFINGNYPDAENLLVQALGILEMAKGQSSPQYAFVKRKFAELYIAQKKYTQAELVLNDILNLQEKLYGKHHYHYLATLGNLALLYYEQERLKDAEALNLRILNDLEAISQTSSSHYVYTLNNLALVYKYSGNFIKAEPLFLKVNELMKNTTKVDTWDYLLSLENISSFYDDFQKPNKAENYIIKLNTSFEKLINRSVAYLTFNDLTFLRNKKFKSLFFPISFIHRHSNNYPLINIGTYENELLVKNLSLRNNMRIEKSIKKNGDSILLSKYLAYKENKKNLTRLATIPVDQQPENYYTLVAQTEAIEKELVRKSSAFSEAKNALSVDWKNVQENLETDEVAIELVVFDYFNKKWEDSIQYSAFIVKNDFKAPKYIPLFEEKQLEEIITNSGSSKDKGQIENLYTEKDLSNLFLEPLYQELEGVKTIFLSPAGLGHQINFSALKVKDSATLGEAFNLHILGSTAEITNFKASSLNNKPEILLYGDVDYDRSNRDTNSNLNTKILQEEILTELAIRSGTTYWGYLPGTKQEVEQINSTAKNKQFESTIINGEKATEQSIKQLDGKPNPFVLHLATHGYFFSNSDIAPDKNAPFSFEEEFGSTTAPIYKTSEDPMMRSGLLFAGANQYWGKALENIKDEDGILTAREISNLDLSACELVVLSACDTGLGEIKGSEGVFGLQRAFKMAGVKNIIMSLWKVPDEQTAELFDVFYKEALNGKSIPDSFKIAQIEMAEKYSPFYWAGFVLLE